jgi:hypothetical protein
LAVCDLPAIRKLIGYASHSANKFCSFCYLSHKDNRCLNYNSWELRTIEWHREESQAWKAATTHSKRDELFKQYGVQWSILNKLCYWNPIDFTVVEPMHFISGMLEWLVQTVWGLDKTASELKKHK